MKFIHTGDLHLSSPMDSKFSSLLARQRKEELFECFQRLSDYAVTNEVTAILLCGDVFDSKTPPAKDVSRFFDIIKSHNSIDYIYIAGNHDEKFLGQTDLPKNFKTFGETWGYYTYGETDIYGVSITANNFDKIYGELQPVCGRKNIVLLHGQIKESRNVTKPEEIALPLLAEKSIDYLALGHIHSFKKGKLSRQGIYCYCGCPEGRGYDECGEKGFVLLTVNETIQVKFVPFAKRTVQLAKVNISSAETTDDVLSLIGSALSTVQKEDLVRVLLTGSRSPDFHPDKKRIEEKLRHSFFHASVKDETVLTIDPRIFPKGSLEEAFYRTVMSEVRLTEQEMDAILTIGLSALQGEEAEFL